MGSEEKKNDSGDRRDFVGKCAAGAFVGAVGLAAAGSLCGLKPSVLPDPSEQFKIGSGQDFPVGSVKVFEKENVAVFSEPDGLYAISLVCTHLGCIVSLNSKEGQFDCPCHGSQFTLEGKVTRAPAPKPLPWFKITAQPSGSLMVDKGLTVENGTKVVV
jgi:cytochrome b6-f complex iron-sulfur subunit